MTRTPSRSFTLALVAASLLALSACSRQSESPQQAADTTAPSQTAATPAASGQQPAEGETASDQSTAQTASPAPSASPSADGGNPSLEHLAAVPASAALPTSNEWKAGVNYDVISPAQSTTVAPGKVEVLEVFWLACPHCYALEPYIQAWRKTMPDYVKFVRVPIMWGPVHRADARLYYTLEALGRQDLVDKVFGYIHDVETQTGNESALFSNDQQQTFQQQQSWAVQNGVKADAFAQAYNSFFVNTQLQQAEETMNAYEVQAVPFIAVDGRFRTDVEKAGGPKKLISLIDFLATWEHDHKQG